MKYRITADALVKPLDDGAMALNTATGEYYSLNATAAFAWGLLEKGFTQTEMVDAIVAQYQVSPEMATGDLAHLLSDLQDHGLIAR